MPRVEAPAARPGRGRRPAETSLRYLGAEQLRIRGAVSRRLYEVSRVDRELAADARDVAALMRTGLFQTTTATR